MGERGRGVWGAVGAGVIVVGAGCGGDDGDVTGRSSLPPTRSISNDEVVDTLAAQRAKWVATSIGTYEFTLFWGAFIEWSGDYRVTVVDGAPVGLRRIDAVEEVDPRSLAEVPETIDEVFDLLEREVGDADRVDASYDPEMGYPVAVLVDRIADADDDELEMRISDLTFGTS